VLVLMTGEVYEIHLLDGFRWHDTYIPCFMTIGSGIQVILKLLPQESERLHCWCYVVEMVYIPSFMKKV
jgi:hypothetical protein